MLQVDNSGKGNCMFYAYSISLMYYLRSKKHPETTETIFTKLNLKDEDKARLRTVLSKNPNLKFTSHEIKNIIEPILGRATRTLAAEHTEAEFKSAPKDTPLFTAANYGLEYCYKVLLTAQGDELASLVDHEFVNTNFTEAEIYRVHGMTMEMGAFSEARLPFVLEEFQGQWAVKKLEFEIQRKQLTENDIQFHKTNLLDNIIRNETVAFFSTDDDKHLKQYIAHLQKEYVWGTEETLFVLHRAIQGERMVRNPQGRIDTFYDTEIILHLYRNGHCPYIQAGSPEMLLNNHSNAHWTSRIPDSIFAPQLTINEQKLQQLLDDMQVESDKTHPEEHIGASDWIYELRKQVDILTSSLDFAMKKKALDTAFQLINKVIPKLGGSPSWRALFGDFFPTLTTCVPTFLRGNHSPKGVLSESSQHALFKKYEGTVQKTYPTVLAPYVLENKQTGPRVAKALRHMYKQGLEGNKNYSPEACRDLAEHYLNYAKYNHRHFNLTDVKRFIKEMNDLINSTYLKHYNEFMGTLELVSDQVTTELEFAEQAHKASVSIIRNERIALLYKTLYEWVDTVTANSFRSLIDSSLKKYESEEMRASFGVSSARRERVEDYMKENSCAKALALIFINEPDNSAFNEYLFVRIIRIIKRELARSPAMLQEQKYQLIEQLDLEEDISFYLANLKHHAETLAPVHDELKESAALTM